MVTLIILVTKRVFLRKKKLVETGERGYRGGAVRNDSLRGVCVKCIVSINLGNLLVHHLH